MRRDKKTPLAAERRVKNLGGASKPRPGPSTIDPYSRRPPSSNGLLGTRASSQSRSLLGRETTSTNRCARQCTCSPTAHKLIANLRTTRFRPANMSRVRHRSIRFRYPIQADDILRCRTKMSSNMPTIFFCCAGCTRFLAKTNRRQINPRRCTHRMHVTTSAPRPAKCWHRADRI